MKKFYHYITWVLFLWVMVGSLIIVYFQNIDGVILNKPITFSVDTQKLKVDKQVYRRGDPIFVVFSFCRHRNYTAKTSWRLINDTVIAFPEISANYTKTCFNGKAFIGTIPPYSISGLHHLEGTSALRVNALNTIFINYRTEGFTVK